MTWGSISSSCLVYSKHSKANKDQYEKSPESVKAQLERMYNDDPLELHNHCENFKKFMENFFKAKNKAFHLTNNNITKEFENLEKTLQMFPKQLCSYHQLNDRDDIPDRGKQMASNRQFIDQDGPEKTKKSFEFIKSELRKIILYKK